jgi:dihydroorotate dehydrogenase (NAD+) catalytic subunit
MTNLSVKVAGVEWKNPVTTASGTFASGREFSEFFDISILGAVTTKGVSAVPWNGNPTPRIAETYGGMLNAIGLENPGAEAFIQKDMDFLLEHASKIIINICGHSPEQYSDVARIFDKTPADMIEINISCPNISEGGLAFGTSAKGAEKVVSAVRKATSKPLIVKLSPNVTDITEIARAAQSAGADALSLINTLVGMKIDINKKRPVLANTTGGLSGAAIKPVAVRMVWQVYKAVSLPIIGIGGISNANDAIEFMLAGASAIAIGTAAMINPLCFEEVIQGLEQYAQQHGVNNISELTGGAHG